MTTGTNYILGVYGDDDAALKAVKQIRAAGVKVHEVYSPFPIHGIDEALGYKRSRLPRAAFMFGTLGLILALTMQFWMLGYDWQMIIGGKNYASLPPFIPVTFELTVLLSALGMVATFMIASDLKPYKKARIFDIRITDDKHVVAIDLASNNALAKEEISSIVAQSGAEEVNEKIFE
ncbi:MAG: DUF3341 domain-containing protein [Cyclobacteriaceae bacterium]|nr:DUF3341 domain-containing protein [Cyclobacteriaceae bacterium]